MIYYHYNNKLLYAVFYRVVHNNNLMLYFYEPTSFDGTKVPNKVHPSILDSDVFPKMRTFTFNDLFNMAGYILVQAKVGNEKWGGGKIYY